MTDMSSAADKIRQAAEDMVLQDQRIADNAQKATDASNAQSRAALDASIAASRSDQRAWIVLRGIEGIPILDQPWPLKVYFANSGKTPAKHVRVDCHVTPAKIESEIDFSKVGAHARPTMIAPNDPTTYCPLNPLTIAKVNQDVLDFFSNKKAILFAYGSVTYEDIFGKEHWLTFCRSMEADGKAWDSCETHNDTGDGKRPSQ
jgi:hypothetical protein